MSLLQIASLLLAFLLSPFALAKPLHVVSPLEVSSLEPDQNGYLFTRLQVAETLVTVDRNGKLTPLLATGWTISRDGLAWHFNVRKNVLMHDGSQLNAGVVQRMLERARQGSGVLSQAPISHIEAKDSEVVILLSRPFAPLAAYLANYSTQILADSSFDKSGKAVAVIGSGPYQIKQVSAPLKVSMVRFDHYWKTPAHIKEVEYLAVGKGETRALMAQSGQADLVFSLLPLSVNSVKRAPNVSLDIVTLPRTRLLKLNVGSPFFSDVRVRQALSLALDRPALATAILRNSSLAATQLFPPSVVAWHDRDLPALTRDLDKARALLREAGWQLGADGVLQKDGQAFHVTLTTFSTWPELPVLATAIQAQWREVGVDLAVSVGNSSEIVSKHRDGSLQVGLLSRNFSLTPDPLGVLSSDFGSKGGDWGAMNWSNNELTSALQALESGPAQQSENQQLHVVILRHLQQELPVIPIAWSELVVASNKQLSHLYVDPYELSYHLAELEWKP
ncbi:ABC transporter substrate-binding protein [Aeromonas hydrophila]|uniref:ABC transporter substrate-binding protein n=1 Tax=Aeromonas hydrophila TaxID=644 RepID=UPI003D1A7124